MSEIRVIFFVVYVCIVGFFLFYSPYTDADECPKQCSLKLNIMILIFLVVLHILAGVAIFKIHQPQLKTLVYTVGLLLFFLLSVTAGQHRLYTHRTYDAHWIVRFFFMVGTLVGFSSPTMDWCKIHKLHHRYSDTCGDPHYSSSRTFSYSHFGWVIYNNSDDFDEKTEMEDLSDTLNDPFVVFQKKYYFPLLLIVQCIVFGLPFLWNDGINGIWLSILRIMIGLNCEFSVNSLAHHFGDRPYTPDIPPAENSTVTVLTGGEGYHNYHHTFPRDFRTCDSFEKWNLTTSCLLFLHSVGLVQNLKIYDPDTGSYRVIPWDTTTTSDNELYIRYLFDLSLKGVFWGGETSSPTQYIKMK